MAALTKDRNTAAREALAITVPVKAGAKIFYGSLVVADDGYAKPAVKAESLIALGRADEFVDNSSGADGAAKVRVRRGAFWWANDAGGRAVTVAETGKSVYITDDQTVSKTAAGSSVAGKCLEVTDDEVLVETR